MRNLALFDVWVWCVLEMWICDLFGTLFLGVFLVFCFSWDGIYVDDLLKVIEIGLMLRFEKF